MRLVDFVAAEPLVFRPGARYAYSNSDNIAVALMAEAVTGRRYEDLLARLVYRPLDLRSTSLPQGYRMPEPYMHGYDVTPPDSPEDLSEVLSASGVWASGGIVSTPKDMTAFIRGYAEREADLRPDTPTAAELGGRRIRTRRPGGEQGRSGDLPVHHPLRCGVRPHGELPGLHAAHRSHPGRQAVTDLLPDHPGQQDEQTRTAGARPGRGGELRLRAVAQGVTRMRAGPASLAVDLRAYRVQPSSPSVSHIKWEYSALKDIRGINGRHA